MGSIQRLQPADFAAIVPVIAHAVAVFGDEHKASHWLATPLSILEGLTPTEVLQTPGGVARIETILTRIEHNIPS
jgi:putative toxin-antitoxin system antitoxin component (TIGR02293 family)